MVEIERKEVVELDERRLANDGPGNFFGEQKYRRDYNG